MGGGITERPEFYDAADRLGILVLIEFWMTGDNNGGYGGAILPADMTCISLCQRCHSDAAKPSLSAAMGWWERAVPGSKSPPADIAAGISGLISKLDPGVLYSKQHEQLPKYDPEYALAPKDGPYGT